MTDIDKLLEKIAAWQAAETEYLAACDETLQINDGKSYPSSPRRRAAIKALDAIAMEMTHDVHNNETFEMLTVLAAEIARLQAERDLAVRVAYSLMSKSDREWAMKSQVGYTIGGMPVDKVRAMLAMYQARGAKESE